MSDFAFSHMAPEGYQMTKKNQLTLDNNMNSINIYRYFIFRYTCIFLIFISFFLYSSTILAEDNNLDKLFKMSIEELMQVEITTASLTPTLATKSPAIVTVITSDMIEKTSGKMVIDLIELYVPDAFYMTHIPSLIGFRGILNDRNTKTLLMVNGKPVNNLGHSGANLELMHWDKNDIERIDVVSGPGSVIYGPGAINGVINIITKSASDATGLHAGVNYHDAYRSRGGYISYGYINEKEGFLNNFYVYGSGQRTQGAKEAQTYEVEHDDTGVLDDFGYGKGAAPFWSDAFDEPQIKFHLDMEFNGGFSLWARYTKYQLASYYYPTEQITDVNGVNVPQRPNGHETTVLSLNHEYKIKSSNTLNSSLEYRRQNYFDYSMQWGDTNLAWDEGHIFWAEDNGHGIFDYSEDEYHLQSTLISSQSKNRHYAIGASYTHLRYEPYIQSKIDMAYFDSPNLRGELLTDYNNFYVNRYAVFSEANATFDWFTSMFSARLDKHDWSTVAFSTKIALMTEINPNNTLKLIAQRSLRIPSTESLLKSKLADSDPENEFINSYEFIYIGEPGNNFSTELSVAYLSSKLKGWISSSGMNGEISTIGKIDLLTSSLTTKWTPCDKVNLGLSYALSKQLDFDPASGVVSQFITTKGFDSQGLKSVGNDLTNFPRHLFKLYSNIKFSEKLWFHTNAIVMTGFNGMKDIITQYDQKFAEEGGTRESEWQVLKADLNKENYGDTECVVNMSLVYKFNVGKNNLALSLFGHNLLENKRYNQNFHNGEGWPLVHPGFIKEPRSFGLKIDF